MKELKSLNKYLLKYKSKLILGLIITIISRIFSIIAPRLVGDSLSIIENYLTQKADFSYVKDVLLMNILIIIGTSILAGFFTFLMRQTIINVSRYIEFDLKNEIFWHYQKLTQSFYKKNRTGDLMNRISEDVSKVRMYFGPAIMYSINTITLFIIVISYMFAIAPKLTLYTIIPLPILSIIIYKLSEIINFKSTKVQEMLSDLSSFTQENFSGISIIKSYNLARNTNTNFKELSLKAYRRNLSLAKVQAWFFPLMLLLIGLSNLIVIYIGGNQYINGEIEIGVVAEFIIYVNMLNWPVTIVGWVTSIIQQAEASQKRINEFLNKKPEIVNGSIILKDFKGNIFFKNIDLIYSDTKIKALEKVSFNINSGQNLGVLGKVGSGKTSILDLITRLYDPSSGTIYIDNNNLKELNLETLRSQIGYVPQNPFLFSESIKENIKFGRINSSIEEIKKAALCASVNIDIENFSRKYETIVGERGLTLSGGQIQRISLARAIIRDPKILILDDSLSSVDVKTEKEILKNLKKIRKNKTNIIVSHRISSIKHCDKILVLKKGKIIEQGNHKNLIDKKGYYSKLYKKQNTEK
jgi:ATP-binding cassette subfamily B protein